LFIISSIFPVFSFVMNSISLAFQKQVFHVKQFSGSFLGAKSLTSSSRQKRL